MAFLTPYLFPGGCAVEGVPPTSIPGGNPSGSRYYPVGLSLEDAMTLAWKALTFDMDWTTTTGLGNQSGQGIMTYTGTRSPTMSGLLCGFESMSNNFPGTTNNLFLFLGEAFGNLPNMYSSGGLYWPFLVVGNSFSTSDYEGTQNGTHTLVINGNAYTIASYWPTGGTSFNSTITIATERSAS